MYQDSPNIAPENINNHGSIQWGKIWKCAASGAINPMIANNIGIPQQNMCGAIVAIKPILTALFFIFLVPCISWRPQQDSNSHDGVVGPFRRWHETCRNFVAFIGSSSCVDLASPAGLEPASNS